MPATIFYIKSNVPDASATSVANRLLNLNGYNLWAKTRFTFCKHQVLHSRSQRILVLKILFKPD
jgi:hypothetical protein